MDADALHPPLHFEAVVVPHRSLSRRGRWIVAGAICGLSSVITGGLWYMGAWPVIGFNGAEIGLAIFLLRRNARDDRASEVIRLCGDRLVIRSTDPKGARTERVLDPAWLGVVLRERPGRVPALLLASRGREVEVGATLGEDEKRDLAAALRDALHRWRSPRFDNPQLRD